MKIGGFQKFSLIDYPDKICAIVFTQGCNFKCPYCYNPELVNPRLFLPPIPEEDVLSFLEKRKGRLDAVEITGGEPTLQKDLIMFLKKVKSMGYLVKLDSNGSHSKAIEKVIKLKLVDYIAMDIKASPQNYSEMVGKKTSFAPIKESIKTIMESNISYEFRSTLVPGFHDEKMVEEMAKIITGAEKYVLQNLSGYHTLDPEYSRLSPFSEEIMKHFQSIASQYVKTCITRGGDAVGSLKNAVNR